MPADVHQRERHRRSAGPVSPRSQPIPFVFFKYGHRIRGASSYAPCLDLAIRDEIMREDADVRLDGIADEDTKPKLEM